MKRVVATEKAPKAIGPYSQAVIANGFAFLSGQIPMDPATGRLVSGSPADETERVLENLKAVLEGCGSSLEEVVRTTLYLKDLRDFSAVNEVYGRYFPHNPPARSTMAAAGLPRDVRVEMDAIAVVKP